MAHNEGFSGPRSRLQYWVAEEHTELLATKNGHLESSRATLNEGLLARMELTDADRENAEPAHVMHGSMEGRFLSPAYGMQIVDEAGLKRTMEEPPERLKMNQSYSVRKLG